jgi:hypothetical protein
LAVSPFFFLSSFIGQRYKPTHTHTHTHIQKRHISSTKEKEGRRRPLCVPDTNAHWVAVSRSGRMDTNDDGVAQRNKPEEEQQQQQLREKTTRSTGCLTPWTYTECILSFIHSGIPSVYVTGGNTFNKLQFDFCGPHSMTKIPGACR